MIQNKSILQKIFTDDPIPSGNYCFVCGTKNVKPIVTNNGEEYICINHHVHPRVFFFDSKTPNYFEEGELIHKTVGAIIKKDMNGEPHYLLFLRRKYPFLYTIPAGHLEDEQNLQSEVAREVQEETSMSVESSKLIWQHPLKLYDPCRRGADYHYWFVFETSCRGEPKLSDEGKSLDWFTRNQVKSLDREGLLTIAVQSIFRKFFSLIS